MTNLTTALTAFLATVLVVYLLGGAGLAHTGLIFNDNLAVSIPIGTAIILGSHLIAQSRK